MNYLIIYHKASSIRFLILLILLLVSAKGIQGATLPFNEDAVFCSYFKISGDEPAEQDIEEFCFKMGRPAYSSFKPSEIFSRQSISKERNRLIKKIDAIGKDPVFIWEIKGFFSTNSNSKRLYNINYNLDDLPQPTPFINSKLSKKGKRYLKKVLKKIIDKNVKNITENEFNITVYLKPEKTVYNYQKRYIVKENVVLPIRYVIFHPIRVQILDETVVIQ